MVTQAETERLAFELPVLADVIQAVPIPGAELWRTLLWLYSTICG